MHFSLFFSCLHFYFFIFFQRLFCWFSLAWTLKTTHLFWFFSFCGTFVALFLRNFCVLLLFLCISLFFFLLCAALSTLCYHWSGVREFCKIHTIRSTATVLSCAGNFLILFLGFKMAVGLEGSCLLAAGSFAGYSAAKISKIIFFCGKVSSPSSWCLSVGVCLHHIEIQYTLCVCVSLYNTRM